MRNIQLTKREQDIMNVFWHNKKNPLTATQISQITNISMSTIQTVLRKLQKAHLIEVDHTVINNRALTRLYRANMAYADYATSVLGCDSTYLLTSELLENTTDIEQIQEYERLIQQKKKELDSI